MPLVRAPLGLAARPALRTAIVGPGVRAAVGRHPASRPHRCLRSRWRCEARRHLRPISLARPEGRPALEAPVRPTVGLALSPALVAGLEPVPRRRRRTLDDHGRRRALDDDRRRRVAPLDDHCPCPGVARIGCWIDGWILRRITAVRYGIGARVDRAITQPAREVVANRTASRRFMGHSGAGIAHLTPGTWFGLKKNLSKCCRPPCHQCKNIHYNDSVTQPAEPTP